MNIDNRVTFETMSEADLEPVLALFQGKDPETVARQAGISKERLFRIRDDLLAHIERERAKAAVGPFQKAGRNDPCPCGSGKKYKRCCLNRQVPVRKIRETVENAPDPKKDTEQARLIANIETAFKLLKDGRTKQAIDRATQLMDRYPDEDRLHDIVSTGHVYTGECDAAIEICRRRLAVAEREKAHFIAKGSYRDAGSDPPALSYYYPPLTWLQKYWIAVKAKDYHIRYPGQENAVITPLIQALQTADDETRFPQMQSQGLELRRNALKGILEKLKNAGPEVIPYLLPLAVKYSWTGLLVPEILAVYPTERSTRSLIDISMFGFAYASGACLHYLEKRGPGAIAHIEAAFSRDKTFDPIKTGIVSVLGNIRTPAAYTLLQGLLQHESPHVVNWAGDALGKFDRIESLPALVAAAERIGKEPMIEAAILRLKDMENARPPGNR